MNEEVVVDTIIRRNLMDQEGYTPYCGGCDSMPRTRWRDTFKQFTCRCGWRSSFPADFINLYLEKWK